MDFGLIGLQGFGYFFQSLIHEAMKNLVHLAT